MGAESNHTTTLVGVTTIGIAGATLTMRFVVTVTCTFVMVTPVGAGADAGVGAAGGAGVDVDVVAVDCETATVAPPYESTPFRVILAPRFLFLKSMSWASISSARLIASLASCSFLTASSSRSWAELMAEVTSWPRKVRSQIPKQITASRAMTTKFTPFPPPEGVQLMVMGAGDGAVVGAEAPPPPDAVAAEADAGVGVGTGAGAGAPPAVAGEAAAAAGALLAVGVTVAPPVEPAAGAAGLVDVVDILLFLFLFLSQAVIRATGALRKALTRVLNFSRFASFC